MMKAPSTISRMKPFAGMSVREIAQASGTPNRHDEHRDTRAEHQRVPERLQMPRAAVGLHVVGRA